MLNRATALLNFADADAQFQRRYCSISPAEALNFNAVCRMSTGDGRVVSNFITNALRGENLTLYGDGSQTRSFCFVDDTVEGLVRLMNHMDDELIGPINIGNPSERTVRDLSNHILQLTGSASGVTFLPLPVDDPVRRKPDISMAEKILDWHPQVDIDDGLKMTIEYFRSELEL